MILIAGYTDIDPKHRDSGVHVERDLAEGIDPVSMSTCPAWIVEGDCGVHTDAWCPYHDPEGYAIIARHRADY